MSASTAAAAAAATAAGVGTVSVSGAPAAFLSAEAAGVGGAASSERYTKLAKVGEGTFGVVFRSRDTQTGRVVAVKRVRAVAKTEGLSVTTLREIKALRDLQHENVVRLLDVYLKNSSLHLVFEYCVSDLAEVLASPAVLLTEADRKAYMRMILRGLAECHAHFVLHRDLKPGNLLLDERSELKIADFGLARSFGSPMPYYTLQVATLPYRAPELVFGARAYGPAMDMWSVGCIFAEMMTKFPLFPAAMERELIGKIFSLLGTPDEERWPGVSQLPCYMKFEDRKPQSLSAVFVGASALEIDLLGQLLSLDPNRRPTAEQALMHPYFSSQPEPTPLEKLPRTEHMRRAAAEDGNGAGRERPTQQNSFVDLFGDPDIAPPRRLAFD